MKTGALRFCHEGLALCLCLVFSSFAARCQPTYGGITSHFDVNFSGNNVFMDSFDSADSNHCIWQTFWTYHGTNYGVFSDPGLSWSSNSLPSRTSDFTLATDGSIINVGNANIAGFVDTAPGGATALNANGSVGDLNWVHDGNSGIEPGHQQDDMNLVFNSKSLPNPKSNGWQTNWVNLPKPANGTYFKIGGTWTNIAGVLTNVGGTLYEWNNGVSLPSPDGSGNETYTLIITNMLANTNWVYYSVGQLTGNIFIDAPYVVLYCTNGIKYSGRTYFTINTNADVTIYTTGNIDDGGRAVFDNGSDYAKAFSIYDVAGYTNLSFIFTGNGVGSGYIYAPSTAMVFGGGGNIVYTFTGAIFCNNIQVNGNYAFHYDESLSGESLPISPWIVQQPTNEIVQVGSNATFSVVAGGSPTAYQWYFTQGAVSNAIAGATNTSLTITNAQPANWGRYSVVVWNAYGSVVSSQAWLVDYADAAATLSGTFNATNGQFQLSVSNVDNVAQMPYFIQASTNLTDWTTISSGMAPFSYAETNTLPQRYYRAVFGQ